MGKKIKVGKQRQDKYYRLAKEAGYRSRAAFKLIQLNKRFQFLQSSRALVDLCAAPGGWMQVAVQNMPMSSLCIGIDLMPIKPINNAITLLGDITTEKMRHAAKKELQTWEADCVLHDGAPNVGQNWLHDAFQQNLLTLSALRFATEILGKNGWFITKVFRSKDYQALIRVFEKLFKKVHIWKPAASRLESAEIFVVCEKYLKPTKVDPALLDSRSVFKDINSQPTEVNPQTLLQVPKKIKKQRAEGYADGEVMLYRRLNASEFVASKDYLDLLSRCNEVVIDDDTYESHEWTTDEVKHCLSDIKVCGPRELRTILNWRKKIIEFNRKKQLSTDDDADVNVEQTPVNEDEIEAEEIAETDKLIAQAKIDKRSELKKKKKKTLKEKAREQTKTKLQMVIHGDQPDLPMEEDLFSLARMKRIAKQMANELASVAIANYDDEDDRDNIDANDNDMNVDNDQLDVNLLVDEESGLDRVEKLRRRTDQWFGKDDEMAALLDDDDEADHLTFIEKHIRSSSSTQPTTTPMANDDDDKKEIKVKSNKRHIDDKSAVSRKSKVDKKDKSEISTPSSSTFADRSITDVDDDSKNKRRRLDPVLLALGEQMIYSSKSRRDLEDSAWNRYANNDDSLPDWFVDDEKKHYRKELPVTKEQIAEYRQRMKEINARPIKKVAEAQMRKRKREVSRLARAKKRATRIVDDPLLESGEKIREMKSVYKKAKESLKPKERSYVVMTKAKRGRTSAPRGNYKVVDKRLKKDNRKRDLEAKNSKSKKGGARKKPTGRMSGGKNKQSSRMKDKKISRDKKKKHGAGGKHR